MTTPVPYCRMRRCAGLLAVVFAAVGLGCQSALPAADSGGSASEPGGCRTFLSRTDFDVTVMNAELINAGTPAEYCWVDAMIRPNIRFAASLPTDWNGRFVMRGGGGYAGQQPVKGRDDPLRDEGYVTASTDTGHDAARFPLATFAYNNRDGEIDYAYRAVHLTAVEVKELIAEYYGRPADYNYWLGCSTGGRQGLMSAQRFPEDFDGIAAGAPVLDFTNTQIGGIWFSRAMREHPLSLEQIASVGEAIYARCDAVDGLEDGLIDDPRQCDFDPAVDYPACDGADRDDCLTAGQRQTLAKIYGGVVSRGEPYFPGQPLGAELGDPLGSPAARVSGWGRWFVDPSSNTPLLETFGVTFMRYMAFTRDDPDWSLDQFDFDEDPYRMDAIRGILDATDPDLSRFSAAGGRMITYHGWSDTALNPMMAVNYYEDVLATTPGAKDVYRLFMVPGMFHCAGGRGITHIDPLPDLVEWVEAGTAPARLVGQRVDRDGNVLMTRPVCSYPEVARYTGTGDANDADSFVCQPPPEG
ncbi:MAG: tannase/feruloyl esterase family alpha/beta hydrolase [Acidobacteria bacterium]|nr:tannase/feruloyl esterase family alpha/beta hydrolase [Acidobacteriota bacterium]MXZ70411.1 tannase/feruloyl esterase family alpha/beta hydrolase [Acidobacteriota bacterium]MYJ06322.1 tannase/feruloyl esterase family alpha/beta hydrolase [Acidobacteriota bacterium]